MFLLAAKTNMLTGWLAGWLAGRGRWHIALAIQAISSNLIKPPARWFNVAFVNRSVREVHSVRLRNLENAIAPQPYRKWLLLLGTVLITKTEDIMATLHNRDANLSLIKACIDVVVVSVSLFQVFPIPFIRLSAFSRKHIQCILHYTPTMQHASCCSHVNSYTMRRITSVFLLRAMKWWNI